MPQNCEDEEDVVDGDVVAGDVVELSRMHWDHCPPGTDWNCWHLQDSSSTDSIGNDELDRHGASGFSKSEKIKINFSNTNDRLVLLLFKLAIPGLFLFILVFLIQLTVDVQYKCLPDNYWTQTADLWNWKRALYQLSHNHCPLTSI